MSGQSTPRFRPSEIRRLMDVYSFDNAYLGSVLWIRAAGGESHRAELPEPVRQSSTISGEDLGPAPTQRAGNPGPITQSARRGFGIGDPEQPAVGTGTMYVGHHYGLTGFKRIPLEDIQTVALERIVLQFTAEHYQG